MKNPLYLLLAAFCCTTAAADPVILSHQFTDFDLSLTHSGTPGSLYALEVSPDLTSWTAVRRSTETAPGLFANSTDPARQGVRQFVRVNGTLGTPLLTWMETYPVFPGDGDDIPTNGPFTWASLGAPGLTYDWELFDAFPDGEGGYLPGPEPALRQTGLTVPAYNPPFADPAIHPGGDYVWRVTVRLGNRAIQGRDVPVFGPGKTTAHFNFPVSPLRNGPGATVSWGQMLEGINKLSARKTKLAQELQNNALTQESAFYDQLLTLLKLDDATRAALVGLLTGDFSSLTDPEFVLRLLKYAESLAKFAARPDPPAAPTPAQLALSAFAERLTTIRQALENAANRAAQLQDTLTSLRTALDEVGAAAGDPLGYLLQMAQDKLLAKVREKLVRLVGARAAGALISLAADMLAIGQLLQQYAELEALCREQNRLILTAIAAAPAACVSPASGSISIGRSYPPGCTVTLTATKYCFVPAPGGAPNDGHFVPSPVPFAGGAASVTYPVPANTSPFTTPTFSFLPAAINCQPGQGPCLLYVSAVVTCPGIGPGRPMTFFAGVIRCP